MNHTSNKKRKPKSSGKRNFQHKKRSGGRGGRSGGKRNRRQSSLVPEQLIQKAEKIEVTNYESPHLISELPLDEQLKFNLAKKGFKRPTEIQDKTLEASLSRKDVLGIARTGTGKTAAFLIPVIEQLLSNNKKDQHALVVVPTRELAMQVTEEFRSMTERMKLYSSCFIGGTNIRRDISALKRRNHLIVGTPGRLLDLHQRRCLRFDKFECLILDEFDRMLDMGFSKEVDRILDGMRNRQQTMLFSATLDKSQKSRIANILNNPVEIKVSTGETSGNHINQDVVRLSNGEDKFTVLRKMLKEDEFSKVIIFDETKHRVKKLSEQLNKAGFKSDQIQGNMSQSARQKALKAFRNGKTNILVATDVASRGIDVDDVSHVINYQLPVNYETYIHRIGRTGRAGKEGQALTFVS